MAINVEEPDASAKVVALKTIGYMALFVAVATGIFALSGRQPSEVIAFAIFITLIVALVLLGNRYPIVKDTTERFFATGISFFAWMFITLLPIVVFTKLSEFMLERLSLVFQIAIFVIWGLLLAMAIRLIATERRRERLFGHNEAELVAVPTIGDPRFELLNAEGPPPPAKPKFRLGTISPAVYSIDLLMISTIFFASVTFVLVQQGLIVLDSPSGAALSYDSVIGFYLWHFLEAIPLLKVNETLQTKAPLTYQSALVGSILLFFKLTVILPVIAAFTWYWKKVTTDDSKTK